MDNNVADNAKAMAGRGPAAQTSPGTLVDGPIVRTLVVFSLPVLASNVLQTLNGSINAAWIGHLLGTKALTASANANSLLFFLLAVSFGLSIAASILVGQSYGARDMVQTKRVMGTSFLFFGVTSLAIAVLGFAVAPDILKAMQTPPDAAPLAIAYLRIIFTAIPASFLFNFMMMALRGAGDSRSPFFFLLISMLLDIGLNPLLIDGIGPFPRMGIAGSATASAIAQWAAILLLGAWLYYRKHPLCILPGEAQYFRLDPEILRSLLTKGVPMGLQVIVVSSSMVAMISLVNHYGSLTVAAYGACFQLWNYIQMPAFAIGAAASSMAAQNIGAGRWDRVDRIVLSAVVYAGLLTFILIAGVTLSDKAAFSMFLGGNMAAIGIAQHMHLIVSWSFILFGTMFIMSSAMRATGAVLAPLTIIIISVWGVRIPTAAILSHSGVDGILWGFPAGSCTALALTLLYYRFGPWRKAKMLGAH